jgi:FKBP-type peptidyl-prolyl cis-trans isomerase
MVFTSCGKDQLDKDLQIIEEFITANNLTNVQSTETGLHYIINEPGTGPKARLGDRITIDYIGYYTDGTLFDSSYERGAPSEFELAGGLIAGWRQGIPLFAKGGRGMLIIPSGLGYGPDPVSGGIRENAVLVFEIVLLNIE